MASIERSVRVSEPSAVSDWAGNEKIEIRAAPGKGLGAFAARTIESGELIERTTVLLLSARELELVNQTKLGDYLFYWPADAEVDEALPLGRVTFANHSAAPNTELRRHVEARIIDWVSLRRIERGEELTFTYRCPLWFPAV